MTKLNPSVLVKAELFHFSFNRTTYVVGAQQCCALVPGLFKTKISVRIAIATAYSLAITISLDLITA